ncbi:MAG TPA: alcohol dehydrogenase catalytic domain-containing protein [Anaerovoracaceae bacterium]|nr:alcohol dehydrogenase catalytic domain-containing protein [Anaerovoracaceae bacterium]
MKAIFYTKPGLQMIDCPEPQISQPDDVKIKISYASVCGSDLHTYKGEMDLLYGEAKQIPLGHEASGVIVELGPDATNKGLKVGDKVTYYYNLHCGKCYYCRNGQEQFCLNMKINMSAMAEYLVVNEQQVFKLPEEVDLSEAVFIEPISVCLHGIDLCRIKPGARVAISGGGGMGQILLQLAKLSGAVDLTMIEPVAGKREIALMLGASHALDPFTQNIQEEALKITNNLGFDAVIEASGSTGACQAAYDIVGRGGVLEFFAALYNPAYNFPLNLFNAFFKEITIIGGVFQSPYAFPRSVALFRQLDIDSLMENAIFDAKDYDEAFKAQVDSKCVKAILKF